MRAGRAGARPGRRARGGAGRRARDALARTPELLPVLAEAGVVDAGGTGFLLLLDVLLHVVDGRPVPEADRSRAPTSRPLTATARRRPRRRRPGRPPLRGHVLPRGARRRRSRRSRTCGPASATRSSWSAATASGTATSTPTTSAPRSRPRSTAAGPARSGSPTCSSRSRRSAGCARRRRAGDRAPSRRTDAGRPPRSSPSPPATGIRRIFHSLGVQRIVTGGQSMNPSTAELLDAVEAAPADDVVILPEQQEHHPGGRAGRRPDDQDRARRAHQGHRRGLRRARGLRPGGRRRRERRRRWPRPPSTWSPARSPGRCATSTLRRRPDRRGRLARHRPRRHRAPSSATLARRRDRLLEPLITDDHEIVTLIEGEGAPPADTRQITEWLQRAPARRRRRGPPRRPAALPVPLRHRVAVSAADGPSSPTSPVTKLNGVGPERRRRRLGPARDRASVLDLLTHYPRRYLDRTEAGRRSATPGSTSSRGLRHGVRVVGQRARPRPAQGAARSCASATARATCGHVLQPAVAGPAVARGHRGHVLRQGRRLPGQAADGQPGSTSSATRPAQIIAVYPQSREAPPLLEDFGRLDGREPAPGRRLRRPAPGLGARRSFDFVDRTGAFRGIHIARVDGREAEEARRRLVFDELLRIQLALVLRKRRIEATSQGIAHDTRRRPGAAVPRASAVRADRRPARGRSTRSTATWPRPHPMHRLLQGDVGAGKTVVAVAALLTAVQGGHQGALMAPTEVLAEQHAAELRAAPRRDLRARRRRIPVRRPPAHASSCSPAGPHGKERQRILAALADGAGRPAGRHPRPHPGGGGVPVASASS